MIPSQSILLGLGWRKNGYRTTMLTDHLDTSKTDEDDHTRSLSYTLRQALGGQSLQSRLALRTSRSRSPLQSRHCHPGSYHLTLLYSAHLPGTLQSFPI